MRPSSGRWPEAQSTRAVQCCGARTSYFDGGPLWDRPDGVLFHFLVCVDAVGGDFDFSNAAEGEQELYEVLRRLFRSLLHDVANSIGDRGLEHDAFGLQAGQVDTHELAWLQHDSKIVPLRAVKCKRSSALFPNRT